jgi:hypothetical protein
MTQSEMQLKRVHEKMILLLKQYQGLQRENEKLKDELSKMQMLSETHSQDSEKFRQQVEAIKLTGGVLEDSDKKMLEKRLNKYVREIDKCIALLQE